MEALRLVVELIIWAYRSKQQVSRFGHMEALRLGVQLIIWACQNKKQIVKICLNDGIVNDVGAETGHEIRTTIGGRNGQSRQTVSYIAEHLVGTGSFGVVFQVCRIIVFFLIIEAISQLFSPKILNDDDNVNLFLQAKSKPETLLPSRKFFNRSATRTGNCRLCKCWIILISSH
ncbi:hypothetical protein G4B88_019988 [Cannabis sativa]|uniref:Uncharacterized protein n=1 Tax=Cannabis sativa TaxID=3483 RepID=A0A7J6EJI5_CANSA|nr:hypothetical protein G4B88_019988 [Cannabis sativa]